MNILLQNVNIGKSWGWGGIESHSDTLAAVLAERGHRVVMGCWVSGSVAVAGGRMLPGRRITVRNSGDLSAVVRMVLACKEEKIDVIIANGGREYWPAAVAAKLSGAGIIFIRHQTDRIRQTTRWLMNNQVNHVIAVSDAVKEALLGSGVKEKNITVIPNSVAVSRFNPAMVRQDEVRPEFGLGPRDIVIGTVGKLHRGKGVYELLAAFAGLAVGYPLLKLLFVGDGPERDSLEQEARRLSVHDRVIFAGVRKDVERMYAAMDIFVLPSTCDEAFGMVLIEAMAMSRPVIGTDVGGIPAIVRNGVNGLLVHPGDDRALATAIARYLDDPVFSAEMAAEGLKTVEKEYSDNVMGERFDDLFKRLGLR